ncbi:MAG: hypothetical protein ABIB04_03040 [Patescibacteria group bacterium]
MTKKSALQIILGISLFGVAFSGTLSYQEIWGTCTADCPVPGAPGSILGFPACVYGFFMYLILSVVAGLGLKAKK